MKCEPGFFSDAFLHLQKMVEIDINNRETCLVVDKMNIKKNIVFNKEDGCYQGFSNYGSGIICIDVYVHIGSTQ